jgi:H+/Cl- antiporter ClcA
LFSHGVDFIGRSPDHLIYALVPAVFYLLGLALHLLYFQIARERQLFIHLPMIWGLSAVFNLLLTGYFVFFGSFAAWMFVWTLCVTILSLVAFVHTYATRPSHSPRQNGIE